MRFLVIFLVFSSAFVKAGDLEQKTHEFYASLNKGDSLEVASYFHTQCRVKHIGEADVWDLSLTEFLGVCTKFKSDYYSEEISQIEVRQFESGLAYVDVYFDFYVEGSYTHSGIDHFCWSNREGELKIESVYSSNFKEAPLKLTAALMDEFMNKWHNDVAVFDYEAYFGFMSNEFIFLGTDPSERWTKETFATFCKPYFERKSTWDFKTNWRNWYFSKDKETAWFEESLDTQMDECRGSGVLVKENGKWKIAHYNLTVLIENEKMKKFLKLRRK